MKRRTQIFRWTKHMSRLCLNGAGKLADEQYRERKTHKGGRPAAPFIPNKVGMRFERGRRIAR